MSSLKERFDEYTPQPDGRVWQKIEHSLDARLLRRRVAVSASAVAAVAVAAVTMALLRPAMGTEPAATASLDQQQAAVAVTPATTPAEATAIVMQQEGALTAPQMLAERSNEPATVAALTAEATETATEALVATTETAQPAAIAVATPAPASHATVAAQSPTPSAIQPVQPATPATPTMVAQRPDTVAKAAKRKGLLGASADSSATEPVIWIPNAFAPDDPDPKVSQFRVFPANASAVSSYEILIYSRQGRLVFHSKDINQAWDGSANGHAQPMGTYVYVVQAYIENIGLQHYKGTITLIR